jgi:hypothetical protein
LAIGGEKIATTEATEIALGEFSGFFRSACPLPTMAAVNID